MYYHVQKKPPVDTHCARDCQWFPNGQSLEHGVSTVRFFCTQKYLYILYVNILYCFQSTVVEYFFFYRIYNLFFCFQIQMGACYLTLAGNVVVFLTLLGFFLTFDQEDADYSMWWGLILTGIPCHMECCGQWDWF